MGNQVKSTKSFHCSSEIQSTILKSTVCSTFAANNTEKEVGDSKTEFQLGAQV